MNDMLSILANLTMIGGVLFAIYQWRSGCIAEQRQRDREWDSNLIIRISDAIDEYACAHDNDERIHIVIKIEHLSWQFRILTNVRDMVETWTSAAFENQQPDIAELIDLQLDIRKMARPLWASEQ